jgi:hypothetical protein
MATNNHWADYLISAVSYSSDRSKITYLQVHEDHGDSISPYAVHSRQSVIASIERGITFCTIYKNHTGENWIKGADVNVMSTTYGKYLRTDKNNTPKDNLGNLPEFSHSDNYSYV